ncbi:stress response translation initiation inhibitor YciH [Teredinibacter haidensis]|uniref:stress response translation initiation inhibitor YciH n=1 Tax=Teredinibacter haidensis TaxID=2731755 RepID=UPI000948F297|nr:stress response translation initiation inhibitor YciH [Teredinibacter haidensis]
MSNSKLVYSTETGRVKDEKMKTAIPESDGIIRIRRETKGRKGKGVTTLSGFDLEEKLLKDLAKKLKQLCGTGGTTKDGVIEIQGDHRQKLADHLNGQGYQAKLAGG